MYTSRTDSEYNAIFCHLIRGVIERCKGGDREALLRRLYLESPIITEDAITILKQFVQVESNAITVVNLMKDLVMKRPTKKLNFLNFLLEFCSHETKQVRKTANQIVLQLHANGRLYRCHRRLFGDVFEVPLEPDASGHAFRRGQGQAVD